MIVGIYDIESLLYKRLMYKEVVEEYQNQSDSIWIEKMVNSICQNIRQLGYYTKCTHYIGFVSTKSFRHKIYPEYKANRGNTPKPRCFYEILKEVCKRFKFRSYKGYEADDLCASAVRYCINNNIKYVICHIDKDLDQLVGEHYNYTNIENKFTEPVYSVITNGEEVKLKVEKNPNSYFITEHERMYNLASQMLLSQSGDNIHICKGIGEVAKTNILKDCKTKYDFIKAIISIYRDGYVLTKSNGELKKIFGGYGLEWKDKLKTIFNVIYLRENINFDFITHKI